MSTPNAARYSTATYAAVLALLLGAVVVSRVQGRAVGSSDLPLQSVPQPQGPWTCERQRVKLGGTYVEVLRNYKHPDGCQALVILRGTRTRQGTLKDYALGRVGQGFTPVSGSKDMWRARLRSGAPMTASVQDLVHQGNHEACIMWFVSPSKQCPTYIGAQVAGAWQRLLGRHEPWFEVYVQAQTLDGQKAPIEQAKDLAARLAGGLEQVVAAVSAGRDSGDDGGATGVGSASGSNRSSSDRSNRGE